MAADADDHARPASTVLLLRDGAVGPEVYVQRRPRSMRFAGGLWVYPGGRVDDADRDPAIDSRWIGPSPAAWARTTGLPIDAARGHVVAAVRETLEESGVLLASATAGGPLTAAAVAGARRALLAHARGLADVLADLGARLDARLLRYWAWWVTPASEPIRYDTRFFVARLPAQATTTPYGGEAVDERWATREDVERLPVIAPTYHTMRDVLAFPSVDAVFAAGTRRPVTAVRPTIEDGAVVLPTGERTPLPSGTPPGTGRRSRGRPA